MANELLTRDDIVRGKKNFDAQNAYMTGTAEEQVTLPDGQKIKTRAGIEKEVKESFAGTGADYQVDKGAGSLPLITSNGVYNTGWGSMTGVSIAQGALSDYTTSGQYHFLSGNFSKITDLPPALRESSGSMLVLAYNNSRAIQVLHVSDVASKALVFFRWVSPSGVSDWNRVYSDNSDIIYTTTTATSANVVVTETGKLQRSTSSAIFKKDIADITIPDYRAALKAVRPVSYRSTDATSDRTDWSWYSFIAEELGALDRRLVQMDSTEFFEDTKEDGTPFINSRELPEGEYAANGINTNGIVALMVHINQQMLGDIEELEREKTQLKTRMTKLEKRLDTLEGPAA